MKSAIKPVLKVALAVVLIAVLLTHLDVASTFDKVKTLEPSAVGGALLIVLLAVILAAIKFKLALTDFYFWPVLRATVLLQFYNLYLPGQVGGEFLRMYMLSGSRNHTHRLIAATVLDRLTSLLSLCSMMLLAFAMEPFRFGRPLAVSFILMTMVAFAGLLLLAYFKQEWLETIVMRLPMPKRVKQIGQSCLFAIQQFARQPRYLALSLLLGLIHQALIIGCFMLIGVGLGIHVSAATWTIVVGVNSLVLVLPITFAGIGTRDISLVATLGFAGVQPETALALSLAVFGIQIVFGTISGLLFFTRAPLVLDRQPDHRTDEKTDASQCDPSVSAHPSDGSGLDLRDATSPS